MLEIDIDVKFRALGMDFGKVKKVAKVPLPIELKLVAKLVGNKELFTFSERGVKITLRLVP